LSIREESDESGIKIGKRKCKEVAGAFGNAGFEVGVKGTRVRIRGELPHAPSVKKLVTIVTIGRAEKQK
jgi:hypothetical protein